MPYFFWINLHFLHYYCLYHLGCLLIEGLFYCCTNVFAIPWSFIQVWAAFWLWDGKTTTLICCWCFFPSYEPELFPGLIYRMIKPRIVLLIFVSGKVVLTGEVIVVFKMVKRYHAVLVWYCVWYWSCIMKINFFPGAKVRGEIYEAFENIYPILKGFRKTT